MVIGNSTANTYTKRMKLTIGIGLLLLAMPFFPVSAQEVHQDLKETVTAEVVDVLSTEEHEVVGTDTFTTVQRIEAKLTSGSKEGEVVTFENEIVILNKGDSVYLNYVKTINGDEYYIFKDFIRHTQLIILVLLFAGLLLAFARWQGARALFSLGLSIGAIVFILVPLILAGYDPALVSLFVAALVLALILFLTHGVNARSVIAFSGTFGAVLLTCVVAFVCVESMRLTGFGNDAAVSLNFATRGTLDFAGLLLGSIIIGILGMLDDVSITQASVTQALKHANSSLTAYELYMRAIEVGKDHIGSLVNTLALAYVGVSLPLVLLFARADATIGLMLNQEVVAAEIVRIVVGSIGLILAVPLTTLIASWYFGSRTVAAADIEVHDHGHAHHH